MSLSPGLRPGSAPDELTVRAGVNTDLPILPGESATVRRSWDLVSENPVTVCIEQRARDGVSKSRLVTVQEIELQG